MTLLDENVDEKIRPYINVTGVITDFDQTDHSFNMCPTQYIALPHTTSPLPLHGYFVESKRWGEGKKPTLSIRSTIAFGGFVDRIRRERNVEKPISSMEIEIANIAYISNRPEPSPNREHPTIKIRSTHKTHTTAYRIQHSSNNITNTMELCIINLLKQKITKKTHHLPHNKPRQNP